MVNPAGEGLLLQQGTLTIRRVYEFRAGTQVSGNQPKRYAITMKPPARIMPDEINTNIDQLAVGNLRKSPDQLHRIFYKQFRPLKQGRLRGQHRSKCTLCLVWLDEDTAIGQVFPRARS